MNPTMGKEKQMVAMILIDDLTNDVWLFASVVGRIIISFISSVENTT